MKQSDVSNDRCAQGGLFAGATMTNVQVVVVQGNAHKVVFSEADCAPSAAPASADISDEHLARALQQVAGDFWAQSSWAVIYCAMRDRFGFEGTMHDFEQRVQSLALPRLHPCPDETVSKTLNNNPYMKLSIDKWQSDTPYQERAVKLADAFTLHMSSFS